MDAALGLWTLLSGNFSRDLPAPVQSASPSCLFLLWQIAQVHNSWLQGLREYSCFHQTAALLCHSYSRSHSTWLLLATRVCMWEISTHPTWQHNQQWGVCRQVCIRPWHRTLRLPPPRHPGVCWAACTWLTELCVLGSWHQRFVSSKESCYRVTGLWPPEVLSFLYPPPTLQSS